MARPGGAVLCPGHLTNLSVGPPAPTTIPDMVRLFRAGLQGLGRAGAGLQGLGRAGLPARADLPALLGCRRGLATVQAELSEHHVRLFIPNKSNKKNTSYHTIPYHTIQ